MNKEAQEQRESSGQPAGGRGKPSQAGPSASPYMMRNLDEDLAEFLEEAGDEMRRAWQARQARQFNARWLREYWLALQQGREVRLIGRPGR